MFHFTGLLRGISEIVGVMLSTGLALAVHPLLTPARPLRQTPGPSPGLTGRHGLLPATLDLIFLLCGIPAFKEALPGGKVEVSWGETPLHP